MSIQIKVPTVGESISEVTIATWLKETGDYVELDEVLCEIESDKATFEITAEKAGILTIVAMEGDTIEIGAIVCEIDDSASAPKGEAAPKQEEKKSAPEKAETSSEPKADNTAKSSYASGHPSPAAAKILDEKGVSASSVSGTGKDGRITKEDALSANKASTASKSESSTPQPPAAPEGDRSTSREKMSSLRKTLAKRLVSAKNETAMLTTFNEVDMHAIMDLRKKYKEAFKEKHEIGLGFMSFFVKAVTAALAEVPKVNAYIDGDEMLLHNYADISIAVSTPKGLVVPVIRNAEKLSMAEVEKEIVRLALKARDGKLSMDEMTGGTFTITNGGIFGSMLSTPILNMPQSAILGMHNIVERPVAINGEVKIRPIMYLALSYDHRIIDGKESVTFLKTVKEYLEDPQRLLLGV